jgi:hypothetical protein
MSNLEKYFDDKQQAVCLPRTGSAIQSAARSVRFQSIRLLREIAESLEQRQALNEEAAVLDIAGPRESLLLENLLEFLEAADAVQDEDLFAVTAMMEARQIWPNAERSDANRSEP